MREKSVVELARELIKRPPMSLIVIGVSLVVFSSLGGYETMQITDISWRIAIAVLGLFLIVSGLLFLRKERPLPEKAELQPEPKQTPDEKLPRVPDPLTLSREEEILKEMFILVQSYIKQTRQALEPNNLEDFLAQQSLPSMNRPLEWWERAITTGQGPRARPVTFLEKQKALRLFSLSSQLSEIAPNSDQINDLTALMREIYSQSDEFHMMDSRGQREYRLFHLRNHIRKAIRLADSANKYRPYIQQSMLTGKEKQ